MDVDWRVGVWRGVWVVVVAGALDNGVAGLAAGVLGTA